MHEIKPGQNSELWFSINQATQMALTNKLPDSSTWAFFSVLILGVKLSSGTRHNSQGALGASRTASGGRAHYPAHTAGRGRARPHSAVSASVSLCPTRMKMTVKWSCPICPGQLRSLTPQELEKVKTNSPCSHLELTETIPVYACCPHIIITHGSVP